jgi:hypothetical protein
MQKRRGEFSQEEIPPDLSQAGPCGAYGLFTIPEDRGQTGSVV